MHTNTFCKYRKKLLASPRVHLVIVSKQKHRQKNTNNCYIQHTCIHVYIVMLTLSASMRLKKLFEN